MRIGTILAAVVAAAAAAAAAWATMPGSAIAWSAGLAALTAWIALSDLRSFEIPDEANIALLIGGLAWAALEAPASSLPLTAAMVDGGGAGPSPAMALVLGAVDGLARSVIAAGTLLAVRTFYRRVRRIEGLGLGDVKLAGAAAPWLAWPDLPSALFLAVLGALVVTLVASVVAQRKLDGAAWIPFGAFLAPAVWVVWALAVAGIPPSLFG